MPRWMFDLLVGHKQLKQQNYMSAKKQFESILKINQSFRQNLHVLVNVAFCQYGMGHMDEALKTLRRCRDIDNRYVYGMDLLAIILQLKLEMTSSKTYSQELSQLASQIAQSNSGRSEAYVVQAVYFQIMNDIVAMELAIEKGSLIEPVNYWLLVVDGKAKLKCRLLDKAALCFRKATCTPGCNLDSQLLAYKGLVDCAILQSNFWEATFTAKQVVKQHPINPKAQIILGWAYIGAQRQSILEIKPRQQIVEQLECATRAFQTASTLAPPGDQFVVGGFVLAKVLQHIVTLPKSNDALGVLQVKKSNDKQKKQVSVGLKYIDEAIDMVRSYLEVKVHEEMVATLGILEAYRENYQIGIYFLNQALGLYRNSELARLGFEALGQVFGGKSKQSLLDVLIRNNIYYNKIKEFHLDMDDDDKQ
eukprot:TRINITY_DN21064_c0_g2_i2.p1 TRINITY_DN21064_c0_g2~~TRINITY_DN21064_c0_g2_i2.p1  ORF type:complete len:420 (-),score=48.67 TRINITY_DN21064_c0_g2_i2:349-1608(-)